MKEKNKPNLILPLMAAALLMVIASISRLDRAHSAEDTRQLTEALRRGAVACYAQEGFYPPDAEFLLDYSGVQFDRDRYWLHYEIFASNLMPDITVIEKDYEK